MAAATLGVPINQTTSSVAPSSSTKPIPLRNARSEGTFRTPNSSDNDLSADGSHTTDSNNLSGHSLSFQLRQHALSLSPPPDLSFSKSSLHSDQEHEFLSRNAIGGSSTSFNQPYLNDGHNTAESSSAVPHHQTHDQVRIASSSQGHDNPASYPHNQNDSWGSRRSNNNLNANNAKTRIRLDSVFGTQLPGFPYLNSAAAATSSALGNPINPHYHYHHGSSSSADLLRGRSSYNWTERSGSAASHHHLPHMRSATSHSMRSVFGMGGKESALSMSGGGNNSIRRPGTAATMHRNNNNQGDIDTSCSGETGESNSSDEVDLDLSFDMDLLRARQLQQMQARQAREQQQQHVGITSSQVQAHRQARVRALSASGSGEGHSKDGHVGIDMHNSSADSLALPHLDAADEAHRRYMLGGKKRLSRSAVELRPGSSNRLHASNAVAGSSNATTPRGPTPSSTIRNAHNHPYRYSGAFSSTMPASTSRSTQGGEHRISRASLDLAVDIPLDHDDTHGPRAAFMDEDESSAQNGWSFATTPPLSPAEIVTYAEGVGSSSSSSGLPTRRYSAGASNLFHSLDRKKSSGDMLQRKRRPSFPLMSLIDKAIRTPVAGMVAGMRANDDGDLPADKSPHSPDSDPSWGSPTPRESMMLDATATIQAAPPPQLLHNIPLIPLPTAQSRRLNNQASISDLARTPENQNDLLPAPPRLNDPARGFTSSPVSSVGTPGTLSPDICNTNSTFSSPRSPSDDLPTPRTADFTHVDGNRYSQFSTNALSESGMSFTSDGSETVEGGVNTKRQSKIFGFGEPSMGITANLQVIPEDNDSPQKSVLSASSISSAAGASPKKSRPQSATDLNQSGRREGEETIQASSSFSSTTQQQKDVQGHKRQSSSLFRFPFISSLRNPFAASTPAAPSIVTTASPDVQQSPSSSQDSPSATSQELLSSDAIEASFASKDTCAPTGKRSTSPNSSEESHFLTATDPPSPPRPGATAEASKGVDPSMLRNGPNTGKGRLSGLGLSFPSTFVTSQPRSVSDNQVPVMQQKQQQQHHYHQGQRQASLPVLSFSAASDEQHEPGSRSVESEEAAIHVIPDAHGYGRPVGIRTSSDSTQRSTSYGTRQRSPASAPATTVHFNHADIGLDNQMQQLNGAEFGANQPRPATASPMQQQQHTHFRRPRTRLLSAEGLDLRGRIDRMRPSQLLFLAAFIAGPWCFILGGWCLRSADGDYRSVKGIRCRCPDHSESCECQAEIYKQIKLSGGQVDRVLQSQNGEVRKMDRFVLANRVGALTCGTGTLVLAITALIVAGRTW